jgi:hypothetical protein
MIDARRGVPVAAIAGGLFCVVLIALALQMRAGGDPAIGAGPQSAAAQPARTMIVRRRVIVRRIVEVIPARPARRPSAAAPVAGSAVSAPGPAPMRATAPAPARVAPPAPVRVAAPAPAPAPAPVVSRAS